VEGVAAAKGVEEEDVELGCANTFRQTGHLDLPGQQELRVMRNQFKC